MKHENREANLTGLQPIVLDQEDPIDRLIAEYKRNITDENLLSSTAESACIAGIQHDHIPSQRHLVRAKRGFIAAVAYSFKSDTRSSEVLLQQAGQGLLLAAHTYQFESREKSFDSHLAKTIQDVLSLGGENGSADAEESPYWIDPNRASDQVFRLVLTANAGTTKPPSKIDQVAPKRSMSRPTIGDSNSSQGSRRNRKSNKAEGQPGPTRQELFARKLGFTSLEGYRTADLLDLLTPKQREAIEPYYFGEEDRSWREIAEETGNNETTLAASSTRGFERLRAVLRENPHFMQTLLIEADEKAA